jgi:hypothetical protein
MCHTELIKNYIISVLYKNVWVTSKISVYADSV